jgi:GNAT superfamily N-acetyltransferase
MARTAEQPSASFTIEALHPDDQRASQLWHELHGPSCAGTTPPHWLVAGQVGNGRLLGVAQYVRTFPPEDACGAVLVIPEALHTGAGVELLRAMAGQALKEGIRNLGTLVSREDHATMDLLRDARAPVRISPMQGGLYVEIDLLSFTASRQPPPPPKTRSHAAAPEHRYH